MSKATKGWVVVDAGGKQHFPSRTRTEAIDRFCASSEYPWSWPRWKRVGYRCVRVTITEEPK